MQKNKKSWMVSPDYRTGNVYHLWDHNGNYHKNTNVKAMSRRARLMELAPVMYRALQSIARNTCCGTCQEAALIAQQALKGE